MVIERSGVKRDVFARTFHTSFLYTLLNRHKDQLGETKHRHPLWVEDIFATVTPSQGSVQSDVARIIAMDGIGVMTRIVSTEGDIPPITTDVIESYWETLEKEAMRITRGNPLQLHDWAKLAKHKLAEQNPLLASRLFGEGKDGFLMVQSVMSEALRQGLTQLPPHAASEVEDIMTYSLCATYLMTSLARR